MIEKGSSFGNRTVKHLPGFNKNTARSIFQIEGWQVCEQPAGLRPRIQTSLSAARAQGENWVKRLSIWVFDVLFESQRKNHSAHRNG